MTATHQIASLRACRNLPSPNDGARGATRLTAFFRKLLLATGILSPPRGRGMIRQSSFAMQTLNGEATYSPNGAMRTKPARS